MVIFKRTRIFAAQTHTYQQFLVFGLKSTNYFVVRLTDKH